MRYIVVLLLILAYCSGVQAKTYYVATTGSNTNPGTLLQPYLTIQYGINQLRVGDTLYVRGGIYYGTLLINIDAYSGTESDPICIIAYPPDYLSGNKPIFDFWGLTTNNGAGGAFFFDNVDNWYIEGITARNATQYYSETEPGWMPVRAFGTMNSKNIIFRNCVAHNNSGGGFRANGSGKVYYYNCDAYNNCDSLSVIPGNGGDGFSAVGPYNDPDTTTWLEVYYYGCRSYHNADGGFATGYGIKKFVADSCWTFNQGYLGGAGRGFPLGLGLVAEPPSNQFIITNCISAYNIAGFTVNCNSTSYLPNIYFYNNTAAYCYNGFYGNYLLNQGGVPTYRNNIAFPHNVQIGWYDDSYALSLEPGMEYDSKYNSWDAATSVTLSNADFISIDSTGITEARQADGSLPDNDCYNYFLKLAPVSDLIEAGIDVGLSYKGLKPDLGYAESEVPNELTHLIYVSSVIEQTNSTILEIIYNLPLANIVPATTSFTVIVNSSTMPVNSVAILGTKVQLSLSSPIVYGDIITIAYEKPVTNPLQTDSGVQAEPFSPQPVINNCIASANQAPIVNISSPTKSTSFISPATITIDAVASDPDGSISKVEFYQGTVKIGEKTFAPYSFTWKEVGDGTYVITAAAIDNKNLRTVSGAVTVVVEKSAVAVNQLPIVSITSPNKVTKYKKKEKIVLEVTAHDPDGTISKVELKSGDFTLAELTATPYTFIWEGMDTGTYIIKAIATDNLGANNTSAEIELYIEDFYDPNSDLFNLFPNPNDGHFAIEFHSGLQNQNIRISIFSLSGTTLYSDIKAEQGPTTEIDISNATAGTYILAVFNDNKIVGTKKFIKK